MRRIRLVCDVTPTVTYDWPRSDLPPVPIGTLCARLELTLTSFSHIVTTIFGAQGK